MRAVVVGAGAVGRQVVRLLAEDRAVRSLIVVEREPGQVARLAERVARRVDVRRGSPTDLPPADVTVVAVPAGTGRVAETALAQGSHVVSVCDDPAEVRTLLDLDGLARDKHLSLAAGVAMAPGLSCVLAAQLKGFFESVEEVHVASIGTGGPACARRHHAALTALALDWDAGEWRRRPGGSGRELVWFPEPIGGADCYRAGLADPLLLVPAFRGCRRVTARLEATRRDRMTSWLPMLRPPHPEGLIGAVRVEMRGWVEGRAETRILGAAVRPALGAGATAAVAARWAAEGRFARPGAGGLAELVGTGAGQFLRELAALGVTVSEFEGMDPQEKGAGGAR
ncbi:MAG: NAD-binding protein [Acidimicrobiales bacterium]